MSIEEILSELEEIKKMADNIDLTQDKTVIEIREMGSKPIEKVDEIIEKGEDNLTEEVIDAAVDAFDTLNSKVSSFNKEEQINNIQKKGRDQAIKRITAREGVQKSIKNKYEDLTRRRAVIKKYIEQFDVEEIIKRKKSRQKDYSEEIKQNELFVEDIMKFKKQVAKKHIVNINGYNKIYNILKEMEDITKRIEEDKKKMEQASSEDEKNNYGLLIKRWEKDLKDEAEKLDGSLGITETSSRAEITSKMAQLERDIESEKNSIVQGVHDIQEGEYKSQDFKQKLETKIQNADTEQITKIFDRLIDEKQIENSYFRNMEKSIQQYETLLRRPEMPSIEDPGDAPVEPVEPESITTTSYQSSNEEVQDLLDEALRNNDPRFEHLKDFLLSKEEYIEKSYRQYLINKGVKNPEKRHPIEYLKFRFGGEQKRLLYAYGKSSEKFSEAKNKIKVELVQKNNEETRRRREEAKKNKEMYDIAKEEYDKAKEEYDNAMESYSKAEKSYKSRVNKFRAAYRESIVSSVMNADEGYLKKLEETENDEVLTDDAYLNASHIEMEQDDEER